MIHVAHFRDRPNIEVKSMKMNCFLIVAQFFHAVCTDDPLMFSYNIVLAYMRCDVRRRQTCAENASSCGQS